ncbi:MULTISPECIES: heme exporter protein CcmD [Shewanella]|uniref:Heme exporter protein D n=1 Tax=Shewanella salipaludis TaxID=2723052 RepID=A0A972JMC5_9GAMM|nr:MULTISPECIES: heme exporter protein CcmD [Shewanella]MCE9688169.1 heme exporter protein CcmD [Shewanella sp. AS16]NMH67119.1 heme exporter protein CcmD [Shewanella salipaludis]
MQFDSMSDFFHMGGYAFYVWLSYGVTLACVATLIVGSARQKGRVLREIAQKMQREQRLKQNRSTKQ